MPTFSYTGRLRTGAKKTGTLTAENREGAVRQLAAMGLEADRLVQKRATFGSAARQLNKRVKNADLMIFTRQLATIVSSGLPLTQGLDILAEQTENVNFCAIIDAIA